METPETYSIGDQVRLRFIRFGQGLDMLPAEYANRVFVVEDVFLPCPEDPDFQDLTLSGCPYMITNDCVERV